MPVRVPKRAQTKLAAAKKKLSPRARKALAFLVAGGVTAAAVGLAARRSHVTKADVLKMVNALGGVEPVLRAGEALENLQWEIPPARLMFENPPRKSIRIVTYNIQQRPVFSEGLRHQMGAGHSARSRRSAVRMPAILMTEVSPDVVVLQEAFTPSLRTVMRKQFAAFGLPYSTKVLNFDKARAWSGGVLILSRFPIVDESHYMFKTSEEEDQYAAKGVLHAKLRVPKLGKLISIFGTHLNASYAGRHVENDLGSIARAAQVGELAAFMKRENATVDVPVVLAGDMNFDSKMEEIPGQIFVAERVLLDSRSPKFSYDPTKNNLVKVPHEGRQLYDYFYVNKKAFARSSRAVIHRLKDVRGGQSHDISDHFPVSMDVTLPSVKKP